MIPTVAWEDGAVVMIDQRRLPAEEVFLRCREHREVAAAIRDMAIRGAPAIGVSAAYGLALGARNASARACRCAPSGRRSARSFAATRPTAVNLFWAIAPDAALLRRATPPRAARVAARRAAGRGAADRGRGPRVVPAHGRPRRRPAARRRARADALQRRRARHGRLRHGPRRDPLRGPHRQARRGLRRRDAAVPAGGAPDRLGAAARRHPRHARSPTTWRAS